MITTGLRRAALALATAGAVTGTLMVTGSGAASASTIPNNEVQLCAQGKYPAFLAFPDLGWWESPLEQPGQCWLAKVGGDGWQPIYVYEVGSNSATQIDTEWYDGQVSGIGIGAEGTSDNPYVWTW
jgi:hypothetical protein